MATIKFVLKDPSSSKPTPIHALVRFNNKRVKYSVGSSILPDHWDIVQQKAIVTNSHPVIKEKKIKLSRVLINEYQSVNTKIDRFIDFKSTLFSNYEFNRTVPTVADVRNEFANEFRQKEELKVIKSNLNDYTDQFIKDMEMGARLTDKGTRYIKGTIKIYKGFKVQFDNYQTLRKRVLDFNDIDLDFYRDYVKYFSKKDYSPNTIGRHIKTLKVIMGAAHLQKLHSNGQYQLKEFKGITEKVSNIYLSLEELESIYNLDLSGRPELETVRDVFLVGCFTALRFSDYSRIKPHHIQLLPSGKKVIRIETRKTGEEVIVPFWHWMLDELINKYPKGMPKTYEQKVNERIKRIGKMAKIDQMESKLVNKQGTKYEVSVPKHDLIKTHTARRSGATNMYLHGIPTVDIMKITSHTLESNFFKYIKVTKEETADRIASEYRINKPLKAVN